jgi:hypothetical protein
MIRPRPASGILVSVLAFAACESVIPEPPTGFVVEEPESTRKFIVDSTGKRWDVTHAFEKYNMRPEEFQFGVGPNSIRPLFDPRMIRPGEPGYPPPDDPRIVIGVRLMGEARAYSIDDLNSHEVVNERFMGVPVAVGW